MENILYIKCIFILVTSLISVVCSAEYCAVQSGLPPDPATGCCGQDISGIQRVEDMQNLNLRNYKSDKYTKLHHYTQNAANNTLSFKRSTNNSKSFEDEIGVRISGGVDLELEQFPWLVFIETQFDNAVRTCTGVLISALHILTAGHCIHEEGMSLVSIKVTLGEYDVNSFPIDCKYVMGNQQCVENILMYPEDAVYHPEHYSPNLYNDVALIKLRNYAPYTKYIRPICLPIFDIDRPEFANLPLQVAGWGKINPYDFGYGVKLSTVVNLVPKNICNYSYTNLLSSQLCAVGMGGRDPCPGDSGGPLMLLYRGTYYLVGIVSGKRGDTYCGSSVPAIYMNINQFLPWIKMQIGI